MPNASALPDPADAPRAFYRFRELPAELRIRVWNYVYGESRELDLYLPEFPSQWRTLALEDKLCFRSSITTPATLQVCRESRQLASLLYEQRFRQPGSSRYIYSCFALDTIYVIDRMLRYIPKDDLGRIQYMKIKVLDVAYFTHYNTVYIERMTSMKHLELVLDEDEGWVSQPDWYDRWWPRMILSDFEYSAFSDYTLLPNIVVTGNKSGKVLGSLLNGVFVDGRDQVGDHVESVS